MDAIRQLALFARADLGNSLLWTRLLLTETGGLWLLTETSGLRLPLLHRARQTAVIAGVLRHTTLMAGVARHLVRRLLAAHPMLFALRLLGALCVAFCSLRVLRIGFFA